MITKISRVFRFSFFLTHGAPLHVLRARESSANEEHVHAITDSFCTGGEGGAYLLVDLPSIAVTASDLV